MEDVEYFNYLCAMIANFGNCTNDSQYRIAMAKTDFKNKTFHHLNLNLCGAATWTLRRLPQNYLEKFEM